MRSTIVVQSVLSYFVYLLLYDAYLTKYVHACVHYLITVQLDLNLITREHYLATFLSSVWSKSRILD